MKTAVLGGGLAGISAALHLDSGIEVELLEKEDRLGGLLRTDVIDGFVYDYGPHLFFHQDPYFVDTFERAIRSVGIEKRMARTGQDSFRKLIDFPYSLHLHGLPQEVVVKCANDFVQCRIREGNGPVVNQTKNYEEYCRRYFGDGFTDHFMIPYAMKIWTVHPRDLDVDWVGERIVLPDVNEVIRGALTDRKLAGNYIKEFRYPKKGGTESFVRGLQRELRPNVKIRPSSEIVRLHPDRKKIELANGSTVEYDALISSLPLPEFGKMITDLPASVRDAINGLRWFGVLLINYGGSSVRPNPYQWIYFDQQDYSCHRIHYPSKLADGMTPDDRSMASIQAEISFSSFRPLAASPDALAEKIWAQLGAGEYVDRVSPQLRNIRPIEYAYAIMTKERHRQVAHIRDYLESRHITTCGRFGEWDYIWTDKVLLSGKSAAEKMNARHRS